MIDYVFTTFAIAILICIVGLGICQFLKLSKDKQIEIIAEWLLLAVVKAEKELGGGTGQIKLRYVYDLFIDKFKYASMFISFSQFSILVDQALDKMKNMLTDNEKLKDYVNK